MKIHACVVLVLLLAFTAATAAAAEKREVRSSDYTDTVHWHHVDPGVEVPDETATEAAPTLRARPPHADDSGLDASAALPPDLPRPRSARHRNWIVPAGIITPSTEEDQETPGASWGWLADRVKALKEGAETADEDAPDPLADPDSEALPQVRRSWSTQKEERDEFSAFEERYQITDAADSGLPAWMATDPEAVSPEALPTEDAETPARERDRYGVPSLNLPHLLDMGGEFDGGPAGRESDVSDILPQTALMMSKFSSVVDETLYPTHEPETGPEAIPSVDRTPGSRLLGIDSPLHEEPSFRSFERISAVTPVSDLDSEVKFGAQFESSFDRPNPFFAERSSSLNETAPTPAASSVFEQPTEMGGRLPNPVLERDPFDR